ncbi:MAG: hypothetical protein GQE15_20375 [Archangiaceae bacterium]|nr:hypothetical protein [Archangiaceae bacterium]
MVAALPLLALLTAAAPVQDARGFRFEVPAGFEAQPDLATGIRTWQRANQTSPSFAALTLTGLGGTIAQVPTNHAIVESSAREAAAPGGITMESFAYRTLLWKDLELEVLESRANANGTEFFQLTVQLPFEHEAMQVGLLGLASNEALLRHDFDTFIRSFDGPVTWKTAEQRNDRQLGQLLGSLFALLVVLAFPLGAWLLLRKRTR